MITIGLYGVPGGLDNGARVRDLMVGLAHSDYPVVLIRMP
jgi:hypothetical protein